LLQYIHKFKNNECIIRLKTTRAISKTNSDVL